MLPLGWLKRAEVLLALAMFVTLYLVGCAYHGTGQPNVRLVATVGEARVAGDEAPSPTVYMITGTPTMNWGPTIPLPTCPVAISGIIGFDICQLTSQALLAVYGFVTEIIAVYFAQDLVLPLLDPASQNSNFLLGTPPAFTFQNPGIRLLYFDVSLPIALGLIALIVAWGGISLMVRPHLGLSSYHLMIDLFPRLLLGVGMAVFGLTTVQSTTQPTGWLSGLIEFTNALDQAIPNPVFTTSAGDWPDLVGHPTAAGIVFAAFAAGSALLLLFILGQLLLRVAVIDLLIVSAPLAMMCWILPETQRWTELWTRTFAGMLLVQPIQLLALNVGAYVAISTLFNPVSPTPASLILQAALQLAILVVVARLPRLMQQTQAFSGTLITVRGLYFASRAAATTAGGLASAAAGAVSGF